MCDTIKKLPSYKNLIDLKLYDYSTIYDKNRLYFRFEYKKDFYYKVYFEESGTQYFAHVTKNSECHGKLIYHKVYEFNTFLLSNLLDIFNVMFVVVSKNFKNSHTYKSSLK